MSGPVVAVTGATGFVGRRLVDALPRCGVSVRPLLREAAGLAALPGGVVVGDLRQPDGLTAALAGVDAVVHCAGIAHAMSGRPEQDYIDVNTDATARLAEAAQAAGVRRFVFLSSIRAQSGPSCDAILTEADTPRPTDAYGRSKLAAERRLAESGLDWVALRPVLVYGPGVKGNMAALVKLARSPFPLPFAGIEARRSIVALDNLAGAVETVLKAPEPLRRPLIVADPEPLRLPDMLAAIRSGLGRRAGLFPVPRSLLELALRGTGRGEVAERLFAPLVADPLQLSALGWRARLSPRQALAALARQ